LQSTNPSAHESIVHSPATQAVVACCASHATPHAPQWFASLLVSAHSPLQHSSVELHSGEQALALPPEPELPAVPVPPVPPLPPPATSGHVLDSSHDPESPLHPPTAPLTSAMASAIHVAFTLLHGDFAG
jgi:hypothetical protein